MARKSVKGRGADLFFEPGDEDETKPKSNPKAKPLKKVMSTFYLSPDVAEQLDQAWLEKRKENKKAQKSQIVEEALRAYFHA